MKTRILTSIILVATLVLSCSVNNHSKSEQLYNTSWQLEFISGPRIAFKALYPDKKPLITFNKESKKVEGTNSCNGYQADFTINGNNIFFGEPGPTTMMFCGQGEPTFLSMMKKVNSYNFDDRGKLLLKIDNTVVMRFIKK